MIRSIIDVRTSSGTKPSIGSETRFKSPFVGECKHIKSPVVVNLRDDINENTSVTFVAALRRAEELQQPFVIIYINCSGGSIYDTIEMMNAMQSCKIPIYTCVTGLAASAAFTIFGLGQRRFIAPMARLMVHDVSCDADMTKGADIKCEAEEMDVLKNLLFCTISRNIGKPDDFFLDMLKQNHNSDCYLNAVEAIKMGMATDIGVPRHELVVDVQHVLCFEPQEKDQVKKNITFNLKKHKRGSRHKSSRKDSSSDESDNDSEDENSDNESNQREKEKKLDTDKNIENNDKQTQEEKGESLEFQIAQPSLTSAQNSKNKRKKKRRQK